jgi:Fe2+ or Zn2+ uptake regulation protein
MNGKGTSERLRQNGLKATKPRQLVLHAFERLCGHHSVDDIVEWLRQQGTPLPRGSVYGVVEALAHKGLLKVADTGPGRALYELPQDEHHHFVCQNCGKILDVRLPEGFPWPQLPGAATISQAQVVFRGICLDCPIP